MSRFPNEIDTDADIYYVSDDITEISGINFNQVRDAIFKIEESLGANFVGSMNSLYEFLNVSFNPNGTIKSSALNALGLVTLPIDNNQVGTNAGILESKLTLDYSTATLYSLIQSNASLINNITIQNVSILNRLNLHISGGPDPSLRHVASQIDINSVPNDSRDPTYIWTGLLNRDGYQRSATQVASALLEINNELVDHENALLDAHPATAITVNSSRFQQISAAENVQEALEELDGFGDKTLGIHRSTQHSSGIPNDERSEALKVYGQDGIDVFADGYGPSVVGIYSVTTYVADFPGTSPINSVSNGDNVVKFNTPLSSSDIYKLDAEFSQVKVGDVIRITYDGYGIEAVYTVESIRFIPGSEWVLRINGTNLYNTTTSLARIDRSLVDKDIYGIVASGISNATPLSSFSGDGFLTSITIADPKAAITLGNGIDLNQINESHYNLYLQIYPTGNPLDKIINLPGIDITGNLGQTPGKYTLTGLVNSANNAFRSAGYNVRFVAFENKGNFGIALSDAINGASFSLVSGDASSGTLVPGIYTNNIIGEASDGFDPLGFIRSKSASPAYRSGYPNSLSALSPTIIFMPRTRNFIVDGSPRDYLLQSIDGYFEATITNRLVTGTTVEVTYTINGLYNNIGLSPGKTITVQPAVEFSSSSYNDNDYGRFILKEVIYINGCPGPDQTILKVINGVANNGNPIATTSSPGLPVYIYFGNDTVGFNLNNIIDTSTTSTNYRRLHEVYVDKSAKTFSHERARLPIQNGLGSLLDTNYFHITDVSPKLRGYYESSTNLSKYLRFYVLNYNSTSGEYDGYLGRRDPYSANIFDTGIIVKARKNIPTKFYDITGVDFIELNFIEPGTSSTSINSGYVDIQVFDSLALDDQFNLLSTVEINWQPISGQTIAQNLKDKRSFGSVSETEFTQSAIDFINSGNKFLHGNGVIRGFDLDSYNSSGEILIKGGLALVNGNFTSVNEGSLTIPQVYPSGTIVPQNVTWAICVNSFGSFESVLITPSKGQYFATNLFSGGTYYLPSVTFSELVNERKDLCLLYIVSATIASVTINSIQDARKYIKNESSNIPLTIGGNDFISIIYDGINQVSPNFYSFDQALTWLSNYNLISNLNSKNIYVKVVGNLVINREVNLTAISGVTFDGIDGCRIQINSPIGFRIKNNITFKNINFIFNGSIVSDGTLSQLTQNSSAIFIDALVSNSANCTIDNCSFTRTVSSVRGPFIQSTIGNSIELQNTTITNCKFQPGITDGYNCSIAIYGNALGAATRAVCNNLNISNNQLLSGNNSILVTTQDTDFGLFCINSKIEKNDFQEGVIGYCICGTPTTSYQNKVYGGLEINSNNAKVIGYFGPNGLITSNGNQSLGTGFVKIYNNNVNYINCLCLDNLEIFTQSLDVIENTLYAPSFASVSTWNLTNNYGILVSGVSAVYTTNIEKNKLKSRGNNYTRGISVDGIITSIDDNEITYGFTAYGIYVSAAFGASVTNNTLSRGSQAITNYIIVNNPPARVYIKNNVFDSTTVNGSSTATISAATNAYLEGNVNHINSCSINFGKAIFPLSRSYAKTSSAFEAVNYIEGTSFGYTLNANFLIGFSSAVVSGAIQLSEFVPENALIKEVSVDFNFSNANWDSGTITLTLYANNNGSITVLGTDTANFADLTGTLTIPYSGFVRVLRQNVYLNISILGDPNSEAKNIQLSNGTITYTY
jgi:hypothetical protein